MTETTPEHEFNFTFMRAIMNLNNACTSVVPLVDYDPESNVSRQKCLSRLHVAQREADLAQEAIKDMIYRIEKDKPAPPKPYLKIVA